MIINVPMDVTDKSLAILKKVFPNFGDEPINANFLVEQLTGEMPRVTREDDENGVWETPEEREKYVANFMAEWERLEKINEEVRKKSAERVPLTDAEIRELFAENGKDYDKVLPERREAVAGLLLFNKRFDAIEDEPLDEEFDLAIGQRFNINRTLAL
ncbi:MAG: hypothetical protein LBN42_04405 [Oscillospiraceae bacterium]|jgi:hypothetical protein|nr:hypothetical protein [Oscillospiraceae bacterium]